MKTIGGVGAHRWIILVPPIDLVVLYEKYKIIIEKLFAELTSEFRFSTSFFLLIHTQTTSLAILEHDGDLEGNSSSKGREWE